MRDLEFLPEWYPRLRRHKQGVRAISWLMVLLMVCVGGWAMGNQRKVQAAEASLESLRGELSQTRLQLNHLDAGLDLQRQWQKQVEVISKLGDHVEAARLVSSLEAVMPKEMSLLKMSLKVEERVAERPTAVAAARLQGAEPVTVRRLNAKLTGVVPTDVDLANFFARLTEVAYFAEPEIAYLRPRTEQGHVMREFEVTFSVNLNSR